MYCFRGGFWHLTTAVVYLKWGWWNLLCMWLIHSYSAWKTETQLLWYYTNTLQTSADTHILMSLGYVSPLLMVNCPATWYARWLCLCVMWIELDHTDLNRVAKFQNAKWDLIPKSCMIGDIQEIQKGSPSYRVVTNGGCLGSSETVLMELENNLGEESRKAIQQRKWPCSLYWVGCWFLQSILAGLRSRCGAAHPDWFLHRRYLIFM